MVFSHFFAEEIKQIKKTIEPAGLNGIAIYYFLFIKSVFCKYQKSIAIHINWFISYVDTLWYKKKRNITLKGQVAIVTEANDWKIRLCKTILETYDKWFQPCQLLVYRIKYSWKILYIFNCKSIIHK